MQLIDGKKTSQEIKVEIAQEVQKMIASGKKKPHLAAILVGNDGGSETYVAAKIKSCEEAGFDSTLVRFDE
ncbi:MAG TPA: tetrahydrofolate dehydrogenase/cyclohydrolase catalytic domain-containing protein, partial [Marinilabiliaceae bacterium]|nr:tetrahydrofolate dehydrogenase/cyclohydrolase catalytic domain-containing protein [Marinilabiliaceae bacterium]